MHIIGSSTWTAGQPLPRKLSTMHYVGLDHEVLMIGKNSNYIIIIDSISGGWDGRQDRSEILSYSGGSWTKVGKLGIARCSAAATKIFCFS